ncbi:ATP-binding cassette domain-containing protein [Prochlorococcus sp. MIT 1223]|uniref:ATP-binding cassette domain-containing protein n=1 Tax=Prochlorococcus sp. MIT 1223 TaxID=3096217 RepID=UPI002A750A54|nr:ATP-binding cassette domain-containing protein [Prochlorococcus sp. MIT 1223]
MSKLIELNGINLKSSRGNRLKDIQLTIYEGEKIALLGKSGAGKTSLISVANGSIKPSNGEVKWKGQDLKSLNRRQRIEIGTLWQDLKLVEELNVQQNINIGALGRHSFIWALKNLFGEVETKQCISCLNAAGLSKKVIRAQVNQLSGGQRQRVAIARLLRQKAHLIIADEPFTSLDPHLSTEILNLLLHSRSIFSTSIQNTFLISLHQPELICHFSRVIGLNEGEVVLDSPSYGLNYQDLEWLYNE